MSETKFVFKPKEIPTEPGCYLYWDKDDQLLYVGKAKNLRKRVSSYFNKTNQSPKTQLMVSKITRIETRCVGSEIEALILENNLIKEYRPRFNVLLRDDKNFLYLRVTNEDEPKLELVRRVSKDGSTYIGPKTSSRDFRDTIKFCQKWFGAKMVKPGQDYYINQLTGHQISPEEYRQNIERMKRFLKGNTKEVEREITERMMEFARTQKFEAAAKLRDTLESIQKTTAKQTVEFTDLIDRDFVNFLRAGKTIYLVRMAFRQGRFRDLNHLQFRADEVNEDQEIIEQFLTQFYDKVTDYPREIFVPLELEDPTAFEQFLSDTYFEGGRVEILTPQKGDKKKILQIALTNAKNQAAKEKVQALSQAENFSKALPELAEVLNLKKPPARIECFDISHLSGTHTVASMVVFVDGKPKNSEYRRFKIKSLEDGKIDDFASMKEVLARRFSRSAGIKNEELRIKNDGKNINKSSEHSPPAGDGTPAEQSSRRGAELKMKPVETDQEWDAYHHINEHEIFKPHHQGTKPFVYQRDHPDWTKPKNHPQVFILQNKIIGVVRLDHLTKTRLAMRVFGISTPLQRQGHGTAAIELIENYALENGFKSVVLNAHPEAIPFYQKQGYELEFWKGDAKSCTCKPMGKKLTSKKAKWVLPDLVVIDGGKGQLSSVMKGFKTLNFSESGLGASGADKSPDSKNAKTFDPQTQVIALAKREEQIFRPGSSQPIELSFDSPALKLLQRLRDEAHRFAISFNRSLRGKAQTKSVLDEVSGIGAATKKKLMQQFETVGGIRDASDESLLTVLNQKQLENLRRQL